ncbi:uncharacterized protein [Ptychodera flava]|uniref:uncharacterized protein n=1 Tax=Ptychodera flava TaxID=63121 RepID=UPI003969D2EB
MNLNNFIQPQEIQSMVYGGQSHRQICDNLRQILPSSVTISERSVRRYCLQHGIRRLQGQNLDRVVTDAVREVGPAYGLKTMKGYLTSKGIHVGRRRLAESMKRSAPDYHEHRRNDFVRRTNPIPYYASYHGNKLHVDQNEKLVMFGVTHIIFIDGYSRKIVGHVTMPLKNPIAIYKVYREIVLRDGLWDMLRLDHGREFCLINYVQTLLMDHRTFGECPPVVQSRSRENLRVERQWPEVNQRFNYTLKSSLISMQHRMMINMFDDTTKFCVSFIACNVAQIGMGRMVQAWNNHPLEGIQSRVPNVLAGSRNRAAHLHETLIPSVEEAVQLYEDEGGHLSREGYFGVDPLRDHPDKIVSREQRFTLRNPSFDHIFSELINGNTMPFENAVLTFIAITERELPD